jgi:hypothetical protein
MHSFVAASALAAVLSFPSAAISADQQSSQQKQQQPPPPTPEQQDAAARKKLEEDIAKELGQGGQKSATAPAQGQPAPAAQASTGGNPMARLLLLPDISAIASFAGAFDTYDVEHQSPREGPFGPKNKPTPLFEELELALQAVIDPYARADIFISFTPDEVAVEEAYLTTLNLPAGLQLRAGKFFSPFGRLNQQHPHVWDFVDAPLASGRLLATEVLSGPGVDVAWLAPLPWFAELHLAGQGTAPMPTDEDPGERLTLVARLLQYFSLGDATTLGIGISAARRSEATSAFRDMGGADLYLRWRPLQSRSYVALQGEIYTQKFRGSGLSDELSAAMPALVANVERGRETGGYAQLFWRRSAYWGYGVRYDNAPIGPAFGTPEDVASGTEHRYGAIASWFPSEFQRLRLQVSYDTRPGGQDGVEVLLGLEFGIGSHGAHPF